MSAVHQSQHVRTAPALVSWRLAVVTTALLVAGGCTPGPRNSLRVVNYSPSGEREELREAFDDAWYTLDEAGNADIVLVSSQPDPAVPRGTIQQALHIRTVWRSVPGRTTAETTQVNGTIRYRITSSEGSQSYEGAGSLFFHQATWSDRLIGEVEFATLHPLPGASTTPLFHRAEVTVQFAARHDPRRTTRLANDLARWFAAPPQLAKRK